MKLSQLFGKACCAIGLHEWDNSHVEEGPKKSWAGLCSMWEYSAQAGKRPCARDGCDVKQNIQRYGEFGGGDSPWRRASAKRIAEIEGMEDASAIRQCIFHRNHHDHQEHKHALDHGAVAENKDNKANPAAEPDSPQPG